MSRFAIVSLLVPILALVVCAPLAAQEPAKSPAAAKDAQTATTAVAHIKLSGDMSEAPTAMDPLLGTQPENLRAKLDRIRAAKKDKNIQALYLQIENLEAGYGKLNELRAAIADFKKSGKKVYVYFEEGSSGDYLLAAAGDVVAMPAAGWLMLTGVRAELEFYKDLLDKLNVKADMMQMGSFKGAGETFTRSKASPENRLQWEAIVEDNYAYLVQGITESRKAHGFTTELTRKLIDQGPFTARQALEHKLVDQVCYAEQLEEIMKRDLKAEKFTVQRNYGKKKAAEIDLSNPFAVLKLLAAPKEPRLSDKPKIALIYAVGPIVSGKSGFSLLGGESMGSTTMIEAIKKAEKEPTVKAIVLRVDSPGGSALASDLIWNELIQCKKPVVASMSDVAGSGGYYISMPARKIFAEPGTITGSIGVVGGKYVLGGLFEKAGVNIEIISRGANSGALSFTTPFTEGERKAMLALMHDIYDQFLDKTIQGRQRAGKQFSRSELEKLAGGRIWSGTAAKANGLIDEIGTLDDALAAAKEMAGLPKEDEVELLVLPKGRSFLDSLMEAGADAELPIPKGIASSVLQNAPEVTARLRAAAAFLQLRHEPVLTIIPYRIEMK